MATSLIAFGANLGDRASCLDRVCDRLSNHECITFVARSSHYETAPIGGPPGQASFLNAALLLETSLQPHELLMLLQQCETELGRERQVRWDQRCIDLDLLLYDTLIVKSEVLQIPHPHMSFRRFVLEPAVEIAPSLIHPSTGWSIQQLFHHLCSSDNYVALVGAAGTGKTRIATAVSRELNGHLIVSNNCLADEEVVSESAEIAEATWLEQRLGQLAPVPALLAAGSPIDHDPQEDCSFAISDFWLNQSYAYLAKRGSDKVQEQFTAAWSDQVSKAIQPKLRVLLDPLEVPHLASATGRDKPPFDMRRALRELAQRPLQGPLLHLTDSNPQTVLQDIKAAVQSMQ